MKAGREAHWVRPALASASKRAAVSFQRLVAIDGDSVGHGRRVSEFGQLLRRLQARHPNAEGVLEGQPKLE